MERKLELLETKINVLINELNGNSFEAFINDNVKIHIDE